MMLQLKRSPKLSELVVGRFSHPQVRLLRLQRWWRDRVSGWDGELAIAQAFIVEIGNSDHFNLNL